jgi:hypothetical protein
VVKKLGAAIVFVCLPLAAQFRLGVKVGAPLTAAFPAGNDAAKRPIAGATGEGDLPWSLTLAFDALYNRVTYAESYQYTASARTELWATKTMANRWEFPMVVKRRLGRKWFAGAGIAFDAVNGGRTAGTWCVFDLRVMYSSGCSAVDLKPTTRARAGFVMDGGINVPLSMLRVAPEVRVIRWNASNFDIGANLTQVQFLLSVQCCAR